MKHFKIIISCLSLFLAVLFYLVPSADSNAFGGVVRDKEAIDCGTFYGTKCVGDGEGCDPTACNDSAVQ